MTSAMISLRLTVLGAAVLGWATASGAAAMPSGARGGLCATVATEDGGSTYLGVLSAFPAELAPLLARATVHEKMEINGHIFRVVDLAGVRVVLAMTGIGIVNAATTAETLLTNFNVVGIVFSGVAGSSLLIGDVLVPAQYLERDTGAVYDANPFLFLMARRLASGVTLERCTPVPPHDGPTVCITGQPEVSIGGLGRSGDPFQGTPVDCTPDDGDIFGCDVPGAAARTRDQATTMPEEPVAEDMETAAVARVAGAHGVPWLAFRAVSDGAGDPLGLPGFPAQFAAYYQLAARNAAAGTLDLLDRLARVGGGRHPQRQVCRLLARQRWKQAGRHLRLRAGRASAR